MVYLGKQKEILPKDNLEDRVHFRCRGMLA